MAGIKVSACVLKCFCRIQKDLFIADLVITHRVQSSDKGAETKRVNEIDYPFMCASGDQIVFKAFMDQKIHLMLVLLFFHGSSALDLLAMRIDRLFQILDTDEGKLVIDHGVSSHLDISGMTIQRRIQADILVPAIIMRLKGKLVHIHIRDLVDLQKLLESAAVVVMTVREKSDVDKTEIDTQVFGVFVKQITRSEIKKDLVSVRLDI